MQMFDSLMDFVEDLMRKSHIKILLVFLLVTSLSSAQLNETLKSKKLIITSSLFDYLPNKLNAGTRNVGVEIYLGNRKSVGISMGSIHSYGPSGGLFQISSVSTRGMKFQAEVKHYLNKRKIFEPAILIFWPHILQYKTRELQNTGYYTAINITYQNTKTERGETVLDYVDNIPFPNSAHYKQTIYTVDRSCYALTIKFGYQCVKKYGLTVDYALGLGAQYISSNSKNRLGSERGWPGSENDIPWKKLFDNGAGIYPAFNYQLKLGWAF